MNYGAWLGWQIDYLLLLQNFRDISHHIFDNFFLTITTFGEVMVPIIIICTLYWTVNKKTGQFVLWCYLFGFIVNQLAKTTACIYRPWILDSRVHPLEKAIPAATGYSFPSGHTAGAMAIWGGCAVSFWNNKLIRYSCLFILISVMISRNYVGVHTPQDVVVSFILSCFVLFFTHKLINWTNSKPQNDKYILIGISVITLLTILYVVLKPYPIHYLCGNILYDPTPIKYDTISKSGFLLGAFIGWFVEKHYINFQSGAGTFSKKVARLLVGITILFGLHSIAHLFKALLDTNLIIALGGMFSQYFIIGLFITCLYPFLIKKYSL